MLAQTAFTMRPRGFERGIIFTSADVRLFRQVLAEAFAELDMESPVRTTPLMAEAIRQRLARAILLAAQSGNRDRFVLRELALAQIANIEAKRPVAAFPSAVSAAKISPHSHATASHT